jgi:serine/threonine protein kinase
MTTWNPRANELFLKALELSSSSDREAYLDAACAADAALRAEVESLLEANARADGFLECPAANLVATVEDPVTERPGTVIGPYKLMEQIGEGGMGLVFVAEQQHPVRRRVALKVIKPGMDTRQVIARFEAERQALALMDHPNIAKVHDGGETASRRPYFVMELVKGVPITEYCDQTQVPIRERLELFIHVCQAVNHAHQKGIIHRDIKPSNVLVMSDDGTPLVKVIDFGVAKAVGQHLTDKTIYTQFTQLVGTPLYMSPEQAGQSGRDVDTRTDIYALGVLLYELLTGMTPFDKERLQEADYEEIRRIIREEEPPRPSTRVTTLGQAATTISSQRKSDPKRLSKVLRGELDWIVMMALEKDRNRRYESASAFGADVQRYLTDEPVQACPPLAWYRFRKFARRNKRTLVTLTLLGMVLLAGMVGLVISNQLIAREKQEVARQRDEAQRQRYLARQAVDQMFTQVAEKWLGRSYRLQPLQQEFLRKALRFYQEFAEEQNADLQMRLQTALAYRRVAVIQVKLRDYDKREEAEEACNQAIAILEQLVAECPDAPDYRLALADSYSTLGMALSRRARWDEHQAAKRRAVQVRKALADEFQNVPIYRQQLANELIGLAGALEEQGGPRAANETLCEALRLFEELPADLAKTEDCRRHLCYARASLGRALIAGGQREQGEECLHRVLTLYEELVADFPEEPGYRANYAEFLMSWAGCLPKTRAQEAEKAIRRALGMQENVVAHYPDDSWYQRLAAICFSNLVEFLIIANRSEEALQVYYRAIEFGEKLALKCPTAGYYGAELVGCCSQLASRLRQRGRAEEAEEFEKHLRQFLARVEKRAVDFPNELHRTWELGHAQRQLGFLMQGTGRLQEAQTHFDNAVRSFQKLTVAAPGDLGHRDFLADSFFRRGDVYAGLGQWKRAATDFAEALKLRRNEPFWWNHNALVQLQLSNIAGYRRFCAGMAEQFARMEKSDTGNWVVWTCTLAPGAVDDWKLLARFAEQASRSNLKNATFSTTLGAAFYRAGRIEAAIQQLEKATKMFEQPGADVVESSPAYSWFFLALARQSRGDMEESARCLKKATELADREMQNQMPWNRKLTLELLRREATAAIVSAQKK